MTDPYTSQYTNAKHWCALCKTFIQRDAKSIRFHEDSNRHQNRVKHKLQLAARKKDEETKLPTTTTTTTPEVVVPVSSSLPPVALREGEVLGQYSVRGRRAYLQGEMHEDLLLLPGMRVELSILDEEGEFAGWAECRVLKYNALAEWNGEEPYTVSFRQQQGEGEEEEEEEHVADVAAKDMRIVGPAPPSSMPTQQWNEVAAQQPQQEEEEEEEEELGVQAEYYKGVLISDDGAAALPPPPTTTLAAAAPVVVAFRKRSRPASSSKQ